MTKIWRDRLLKLLYNRRRRQRDHLRTRTLINSVKVAIPVIHDDKFTDLKFKYEFVDYGIYVERGTGRGIFLGNHGDIARQNLRRKIPWEFTRFIRSTYNIREFMAESLGQEFIQIIQSLNL